MVGCLKLSPIKLNSSSHGLISCVSYFLFITFAVYLWKLQTVLCAWKIFV
uniref:Uncharacterized protein n=1 Tax=Rhizophora mucronata TaxID=61149 RepID=A0A2P2IMP9_RHIMU